LVLAADHKIENDHKFITVLNEGINYALQNRLVTFGINPTSPETDFGYIESKKPFSKESLEGFPINKFVEITSSKPAKIYGLYPRKGTIAIGSDADLVIWETGIDKTIKNKDLHHNVDYTPYENIKVRAWPKIVICRGNIIVNEGKLNVSKGFGEFQKSGISEYVY